MLSGGHQDYEQRQSKYKLKEGVGINLPSQEKILNDDGQIQRATRQPAKLDFFMWDANQLIMYVTMNVLDTRNIKIRSMDEFR